MRIGGQRLVLRDHRQGAEARGFQRLAQHPRHRLVVKHHLAGKDRLIVPYRAGIAFARDIGGGQYRHDAGRGERRGSVQVRQFGMCVRRQHRPGVQQPGKARQQIVGVERLAGDVAASAFVRQRLAGPLHAASACRVWWKNFSSRVCATASRYSALPRWSLIGRRVAAMARCAARTAGCAPRKSHQGIFGRMDADRGRRDSPVSDAAVRHPSRGVERHGVSRGHRADIVQRALGHFEERGVLADTASAPTPTQSASPGRSAVWR